MISISFLILVFAIAMQCMHYSYDGINIFNRIRNYLDVSWRRSLPLADEIRSYEILNMLHSDIEIPIIPTQSMDLRKLERARHILEVKVSDPISRIMAKAIEAKLDTQPLLAVTSPCPKYLEEECNPRSATVLDGKETLVLRVEEIRWSNKMSVTLVSRFLERGLLQNVRSVPSDKRIFFGTLAQFSVGDIIQRRKDRRRGVVLTIEWSDPPFQIDYHSNKVTKKLTNLLASLFPQSEFKESPSDQLYNKREPVSRASYIVLAEQQIHNESILQRWSHDSVYAWPQAPYLLASNSSAVRLIPNPTPHTHTNTDRDYRLGPHWSSILNKCPRHGCFLLQVPHKSHGSILATLILNTHADIYLAASISAPQPGHDRMKHFQLVKSRFAYHGCCPPAPMHLYRLRNLTPGTHTLYNHDIIAQGPEAHTYIYLIRFLEPRMLYSERPFEHKYLDTFFFDIHQEKKKNNNHASIDEKKKIWQQYLSTSFLKEQLSYIVDFDSDDTTTSQASIHFDARPILFRDMIPILKNLSSEKAGFLHNMNLTT
uniref:Uncharacterized protein n=1 Tax=Aureoumbra lagunensis TaxID=44058 RepID=A0A7S3K0G0_9STRA|mmetsp:Transcript_15608/g.23490  ORF Transcript_15608/g.23490 Transcript_15608/m.23490 type:complete len:541 (+) Transcript_15608:74-1696(+)